MEGLYANASTSLRAESVVVSGSLWSEAALAETGTLRAATLTRKKASMGGVEWRSLYMKKEGYVAECRWPWYVLRRDFRIGERKTWREDGGYFMKLEDHRKGAGPW